MHSDTYIIIPVYNEEQVIRQTILNVSKKFTNIVCVNDSSTDRTSGEIAKTKATLISHPVNLGQGAALQTGIEYALRDPQATYFVTFDADGQHSVKDVEKMLEVIRHDKVDIVLGSRFLGKVENISTFKKTMLKIAVRFSNYTSGLKLTDTHNGLRVFNRKVAAELNITMAGFAHASEIIERIVEKEFSYKEVPVTITYTDYSRAKGQSMVNAVNIGFEMLFKRLSK